MKSGIYQILAPSGGSYIGSAVKFERRWYAHKSQLRKGIHHSLPLQRACDKYGLDNLRFIRLLVCRPVDLLLFEQIAIDALAPSYNVCPSAGNLWGRKHTDASRAKMSASSPRRSPSKYQIERIVQSNKDRGQSAASREKIAASKRGGPGWPGKRSVEFCQKISAARMGQRPLGCFENTVSDQIKTEIVALYVSGKGLRPLKKTYHTKAEVIRRIVTDAGVDIRRPQWVRAKTRDPGACP